MVSSLEMGSSLKMGSRIVLKEVMSRIALKADHLGVMNVSKSAHLGHGVQLGDGVQDST